MNPTLDQLRAQFDLNLQAFNSVLREATKRELALRDQVRGAQSMLNQARLQLQLLEISFQEQDRKLQDQQARIAELMKGLEGKP